MNIYNIYRKDENVKRNNENVRIKLSQEAKAYFKRQFGNYNNNGNNSNIASKITQNIVNKALEQPSNKEKAKDREVSKLFKIAEKRYLWANPIDFDKQQQEHIFFKSKKKTSGGLYVLLEFNSENTPIDAKLVRTLPTLREIEKEVKAKDHRLMLHPYELKIQKGFWQSWKKAKTSKQRLELVKQYELLKDNSIRTIDKIVLDVDTPFETSLPKVLEIFKMLGINAGYEIGRTKSGNLRAFIYLHKQINSQKRYKGQKHIERLREAYYLLLELFKRHGLELDHTFADRINHPVWFSFDDRFYKQEVVKDGNVKFFDFYNAIKKWQKENQVWTVNNVNLTERFWRHKITNQEKKKNVIQLPAFIRNDLLSLADDYKLEVWKKAVLKLFDNNKDKGRFIYFIMPSIGWAKSLGLNECDVNAYLNDLLGDRDSTKTQKDLKTAWRTAHELTFNLPQHHIANLAEITETTEKALNFIKEKGEVERQELLRNIFSNQKWLCDLVMKYLEQKGLIKSKTTKQNQNKRGRPPKVYELVKDELIKETEIADTRLIEQNIDTQEQEQIEYFSQYNNYSSKRRVASSLEEAGMSFYVFYYVFYRSLYERRNITVRGGS
ncbi:MAG: hypothetical protein QW533_07440, partial [Thermoplasmata archaeon]